MCKPQFICVIFGVVLCGCNVDLPVPADENLLESVGEPDMGTEFRYPSSPARRRVPVQQDENADANVLMPSLDQGLEECGEGFIEGDGGCRDINECEVDNGGCGDPAYFICLNNQGEPPTCADINECELDNGGCGDPRYIQCINEMGGPVTCEDVDECALRNGGCGDVLRATCTNRMAAPPLCEDIDECVENNGGCGDPAFSCTNNDRAPDMS